MRLRCIGKTPETRSAYAPAADSMNRAEPVTMSARRASTVPGTKRADISGTEHCIRRYRPPSSTDDVRRRLKVRFTSTIITATAIIATAESASDSSADMDGKPECKSRPPKSAEASATSRNIPPSAARPAPPSPSAPISRAPPRERRKRDMSFSFPVIPSAGLFQIHQVAAYIAAEIFALEVHEVPT